MKRGVRQALSFVLALGLAALGVLAFRAVAFTIYTVDGEQLRPLLHRGDRVMVNRWSYGLRVGGGSLFSVGRIGSRPIERGDIVAFEASLHSAGGVLLCRCRGIPGDTIEGRVVPGRITCADQDYYWMEPLGPADHTGSRTLGLIREQQIIGRAILIVYNHDDARHLFTGYRPGRVMIPL